jgi:hypothetical protein
MAVRRAALARARLEAKRFRAAANKVTDADNSLEPAESKHGEHVSMYVSPKDTGALRRASMDLTRALAELRKP